MVRRKRTAAEKTTARGDRALAKTGVRDITVEQHGRAYRMWLVGIDPRDIQRECRLTGQQWNWLFNIGDPGRSLPSFASLWLEEVESIRHNAVQAGKELGTRAVAVLRRRMLNAEAAGLVINRVLHVVTERIQHAATLAEVSAAMPTHDIREALRALAPIADIKTVAESYRMIYGETPSVRVARPMADGGGGSGKIDVNQGTDPLQRITPESEGPTVAPEILEGFLSDWERWTEEQRQRFIETGEEPDPKDIVDVET